MMVGAGGTSMTEYEYKKKKKNKARYWCHECQKMGHRTWEAAEEYRKAKGLKGQVYSCTYGYHIT
jgi:transposase-like protein